MTSPAAPAPSSSWEEQGRRLGEALGGKSCLLIVGERDEDAANLALGIARAQSRGQPVAIVDMVGELAPLQQLLPPDAVHGIVDNFVYGVSLSRIAHPIDAAGTISILPSGAGPIDHATLLRRERWRRLAASFRESGGMLLIVLPVSAAGLAQFAEDTDGVVLAGEAPYPVPRQVIATVRRSSRAGARPRTRAEVAAPGVPGDIHAPAAAGAASPRTESPFASARVRRAAVAGVAAIGLGLLIWATRRDSVSANGAAPSTMTKRRMAPGAVSDPMLPNPADSARAASFAVDLGSALNNAESARFELERRLRAVPAATYSPVLLGRDSARWFRLVAGAYRRKESADSLLRSLLASGVVQIGFGEVKRIPFAVMAERGVAREDVPRKVKEYRMKGLPVYALLQSDGTATLYGGAFETPANAALLVAMFRSAGLTPSIEYRIGRLD